MVTRSKPKPKRDEVMGDWRKLHSEKFSDLLLTKYYLGDQIKKNMMGSVCSRHG